jgi:hypothetical protein
VIFPSSGVVDRLGSSRCEIDPPLADKIDRTSDMVSPLFFVV